MYNYEDDGYFTEDGEWIGYDELVDAGIEETAYCKECPVNVWDWVFDCETCPFQDMKEYDIITVYDWYLHVAREGF